METNKGYNVVLEYTAAAGGMVGNRYWTAFDSKEAFDAEREKFCKEARVRVYGEGVSVEDAVNACKSVPFNTKLRACVVASTMPNGSLDENLLKLEISTLCAVMALEDTKN